MLLGVILIVLLAFAFFYLVAIYNGLVSKRNQFKNAYSQIDVQLKRRYDLIPNLVETTKAYLKHERETLEAVIAARNQASAAAQAAMANPGAPGLMKQLAGAEGILGQAMGRLMVVMEQYPDLKANQSVAQMFEELTSTENRISFARQTFNDAVTAYNISREQFPNSVIAGSFGFSAAELLESTAAPEERKAPKVSFG
jgi:LemA protein